MREIKLTQGKVALVDDEDFEKLNKIKWQANKDKERTFYAMGHHNKKRIIMHRLIMNCPNDKSVDHIDGNGLNNQKDNLRICTIAENNRNGKKRKDNKSGYIGVYFDKTKKYPWRAYLRVLGKPIHLGHFKTAEEAAIAYNEGAIKYHGAFAKKNFV